MTVVPTASKSFLYCARSDSSGSINDKTPSIRSFANRYNLINITGFGHSRNDIIRVRIIKRRRILAAIRCDYFPLSANSIFKILNDLVSRSTAQNQNTHNNHSAFSQTQLLIFARFPSPLWVLTCTPDLFSTLPTVRNRILISSQKPMCCTYSKSYANFCSHVSVFLPFI